MSWNKRLIQAKAEATYGTDPVLAAADAVLAMDLTLRPLEGDYQGRDFATGFEGARAEDLFNVHAAAEFSVEAAGSGAAGDAPSYAHLLKACGLSETISAGVSATYSPTPADASYGSVALAMRTAQTLQTVLGARGALSFTAETSRKPKFEFDYRGIFGAPVAPGAFTPDFSAWGEALECSPANMSAVTFGGVELCVRSFSVSDGRTARRGQFMNCDETDIVTRRFTGQMTVEMPAIGDLDVIGLAKAGTLSPLVWEIGSAAGEVLRIAGPKVQIKYGGEQNIEGVLGVNLDLVFTPDQGDDEIAFTFT